MRTMNSTSEKLTDELADDDEASSKQKRSCTKRLICLLLLLLCFAFMLASLLPLRRFGCISTYCASRVLFLPFLLPVNTFHVPPQPNSAGAKHAENLDLHVWTEGSDLRVDVKGDITPRGSSSMHRLSVTEVYFDLNVTSNAPESSGATAQILSALMKSEEGIPWLDQESGPHQMNFNLALGDIDFARSAEASRALQVSNNCSCTDWI